MPINLKNKTKQHKSGGKLSFDVPLELLRDEARQVSGFRLDAYTGAVVDRWWGKLAIAVNGIQASQRMPIFRDHDYTKIVGYSTSSSNANGLFRVEGVFCDATQQSAEVRNLAIEGFPWQASIGVQGLDILELESGQTTQVNGQTVTGPAEIWLSSRVLETSFVPLGADSGTRVTVFSEQSPPPEKKMTLSELKQQHPELLQELAEDAQNQAHAKLTLEALENEHPDLVQALLKQGAEQERARIADVRSQSIPGHEALIAQMELDGVSDGAAAAKAIVAAEKKLRAEAAQKLAASGNPPAPTAGETESGKTMKRGAFSILSPVQQGEIIKSGIRIVD